MCKESQKRRIIPRHICLAITSDKELGELLSGVTIPYGGVAPNIHNMLLPKNSAIGTGTEVKHKKLQNDAPGQEEILATALVE
jgi:hypothetical protein